jgi:hypothetical protein
VKSICNLSLENQAQDVRRLILGISERRLMLSGIDSNGAILQFNWWESDNPEEALPFTINQLEQLNQRFSIPSDALEIWFLHSESLLIPTSHFESGRAVDMLNILHGLAPLAEVKYGYTRDYNLMHAYRLESALDQALNQHFPNAVREHVLRKIPFADISGAQLFLTVYATELRIHAQQHDKILLHQVYPYQTKEDVLYRLLTICEGLGWNSAEMGLRVSGLMSADSSLYTLLHRSFGSLAFESTAFVLHESLQQESYPSQLFSSLLAYTA